METNTQETLKEVKTIKFNYWVLTIIILIAFVIGESLYIWNLQDKIKLSPSKQTDTPNFENLIAVKGVVRTSGLSEEEKQKVGLSGINYQITNIEDNTQLETHGYFLKTGRSETLVGKCVQIIGVIPNEWTDEKIKESYDFRHFIFEYNRKALIPNKIEELSYSSCHPYYDLDTVGKNQLQGTIVRNQRISPFIDDDYEFKLVKPSMSTLGFENIPQNFKLVIKPAKNSVWPELEDQIDKEVIIFGYVNKSGYAKGDSLGHFIVTGVRPLISNRNIPSSIFPDQVVKTYTFDDIDFALYQKGNMNTPIAKSNGESGILYANKDNLEWKEFSKIKELSNSKNNPYIFDYRSGVYYVLIVDANGAGSGEGVAKLMSLAPNQKIWKLESCFYYGDLVFDLSQVSTAGLQKTVNTYITTHSDKKYNSSEEHCGDFQLIQIY